MSVLIKGMEMPSSCDECELCTCYVREDGTEENYRCVITFYPIHEFDERHEYCPLIEIPPHGRLIDADEMKESIRKQTAFLRLIGGEFAEIAEMIEKGFLQEIDNAPTIIEAEEGE